MSTFKGRLKEFPQIRIDYFRRVHDEEPPPLACFLSHVHSDHLLGLESLKAPFVYCSPATREILLRLEKYPHRMNFAKGILETRVQTYRHLKNLLKTIPLDTPTTIELRPDCEIRVTLLDANHCIGAVMILIEGEGQAVLYTGDIRSEPWWINSLVQNPVLIPYAECTKTLDCIYLDTTFASKSDSHQEFPSKLDGLKELIQKVSLYPSDTIFYMTAWTFGYENVWLALSSLLKSQVHLDSYRWSLYKSLAHTASSAPACDEARKLCGYHLGNHHKEGCLTNDPMARIHSCEKGTFCLKVQDHQNMVRIVPIISRLANGTEMHELGIGGGKGDLDQSHELEVLDATALGALMKLCAAKIEDKELLLQIFSLLTSSNRVELIDSLDKRLENDSIKLNELVEILSKTVSRSIEGPAYTVHPLDKWGHEKLPKTITFPYSRHSSYTELCGLVQAFRPKDVYPCTVDEQHWAPEVSMRMLFGHLCSESIFAHDSEMMELYEERTARLEEVTTQYDQETQQTASTADTNDLEIAPQLKPNSDSQDISMSNSNHLHSPLNSPVAPMALSSSTLPIHPVSHQSQQAVRPRKRPRSASPVNSAPVKDRSIRKWAYLAAIGLDSECTSWDSFGGLTCVGRQVNVEDEL